MIQLRTLGRLELMAGEALALHVLPAQPKPLALLAYLAMATPRGPQRRDALLALFWPELGDEEARRALRQALHRIRYHVGDALLRTERDGHVGLADDGAWCDAIAFARELDAGHAESALALYQGAFFDGVFVSDVSPDFEQWVDLTRTQLSARAAAAADTLARNAQRTGDRSAALAWATRASRLAPDDEKLLRSWMSALAADGDRAGALRAHQRSPNAWRRSTTRSPRTRPPRSRHPCAPRFRFRHHPAPHRSSASRRRRPNRRPHPQPHRRSVRTCVTAAGGSRASHARWCWPSPSSVRIVRIEHRSTSLVFFSPTFATTPVIRSSPAP